MKLSPMKTIPAALMLMASVNVSATQLSVHVAEEGTLQELLEQSGADIMALDSLTVSGKLIHSDFDPFWEMTYNGELKFLDLENTEIEENTIPEYAFWHKVQINDDETDCQPTKLNRLILPEGLLEIGALALAGCRFDIIVFPSSLRAFRMAACQFWKDIKAIYCKSVNPPAAWEDLINDAEIHGPFGASIFMNIKTTSPDTPVYVPVGSAEKYREAWGFLWFNNIYETAEFPDPHAGIIEMTVNDTPETVISTQPGHIVISAGNCSEVNYSIFTIDGRMVSNGTTDACNCRIAIAPGIYIVKAGNSVAKIGVMK